MRCIVKCLVAGNAFVPGWRDFPLPAARVIPIDDFDDMELPELPGGRRFGVSLIKPGGQVSTIRVQERSDLPLRQ